MIVWCNVVLSVVSVLDGVLYVVLGSLRIVCVVCCMFVLRLLLLVVVLRFVSICL